MHILRSNLPFFMRKNILKSVCTLLLVFLAPTLVSSQVLGYQMPQYQRLDGPPIVTLPLPSFEARKGDYFVADVEQGVGYLVNRMARSYTSFPLLSGQKRHVCYAGRCYFAATPEREWYVTEKNIQPNRYTFGPTGEFLRLYFEGNRTLYGIHSHKYYQNMLDDGNVFRSMGCILVSDEVLDVIEESFRANDNNLRVITKQNVVLSELFRL